jgi:hypothetical protein
VRLWCERAAAEAQAKWKASAEALAVPKERGYAGARVSCVVAWKDGVLAQGSAKVEPVYEPYQMSSLTELTQGAAHGL